MSELDFSGLTDDQLVELARACCMEAIRRNPAAAQAMQDMMIGEAERARIAKSASAAEIRAARARERERIAKQAREQAQHEEALRTAEAKRQAAMQAQQRLRERDMALLREVAGLLDTDPARLSILHLQSAYGQRLLVNEGSDRYARQHLIDYQVRTGEIKVKRGLAKQRAALAAFAAAAAAQLKLDEFVAGNSYDWSTP